MLDLGRATVPIRLAEVLEQDIVEGKWSGTLPGYRVLSRHYGVSRITCEGAIEVLEQRGILAPAEARKSRKIVAKSRKTGFRAKAQFGNLLMVTDSNQQDIGSDPLLGKIREYWTRSGGEVREVADYLARYKNPRTRLEGWIARENADCLLFHVPPTAWFAAAKASGLPYHMLGGALPKDEDRPSGSGYEIINDYTKILSRLASLGHRRVLIPTQLARTRLRGAMLAAYAQVFGDADHEAWVPLFQELDPKVWQSYWHRAFSRKKPSAVIVENAYALLSLYGYCSEWGIRIPRDLSVVCITSEEELVWTHPVPTRMRYPSEKAVRHFQNWVRHGFTKDTFKFLTLDWVEGDTLARARK